LGAALDAGHFPRTHIATDFVPSSNAKDAVVADPDQPVISASPASAQRVISPVPFTAVGCAVRWLTECRPDPYNRERDQDEDRDDNFPPHIATITTAEDPIVTAVWQIRSPRLAPPSGMHWAGDAHRRGDGGAA
jgi:hypothetical protein